LRLGRQGEGEGQGEGQGEGEGKGAGGREKEGGGVAPGADPGGSRNVQGAAPNPTGVFRSSESPPAPYNQHRALGKCLLSGPRGRCLLMSKAPLYTLHPHHQTPDINPYSFYQTLVHEPQNVNPYIPHREQGPEATSASPPALPPSSSTDIDQNGGGEARSDKHQNGGGRGEGGKASPPPQPTTGVTLHPEP